MRRLLLLGLAAGAAWWLLGRRMSSEAPRAVVGFEDGSSVVLEDGAPELERLVATAREAL